MIGPALRSGIEDTSEGTGSAHNISITDLHLHGNTNHTRYPCSKDNNPKEPLCDHVRDCVVSFSAVHGVLIQTAFIRTH